MGRTGRELITIIGTRFAESSGREGRMTARGESSTEPVLDSACIPAGRDPATGLTV